MSFTFAVFPEMVTEDLINSMLYTILGFNCRDDSKPLKGGSLAIFICERLPTINNSMQKQPGRLLLHAL